MNYKKYIFLHHPETDPQDTVLTSNTALHHLPGTRTTVGLTSLTFAVNKVLK